MLRRGRLIFCAYDSPGYVAGGPNTWLRRLLPDLRASGFEVHPVVIHSGQAGDCPLIAALESAGFPVRVLSRSTARYVEDQFAWLLNVARDIRPTVFVANLVTPAFYASKWLREAGIPVVGVLHSDAPFCDAMVRHFLHGKKEDAFRAVVCVSSAIETRAARQNPNESLIVRIPCGAPVPGIRRETNNGGLRVLYAGRITQDAKRALDVARAFCSASEKVSSATFTLVGAGPAEDALRDIIKDFPRVSFPGAVTPEEMPAVMAGHDVFVLLSDYEGLPIALIEAMACEMVPVCLNSSSGLSEVVKDGVNGVIVADREVDFVKAIAALDGDRNRLMKLAGEARLTVEREYASHINHERWADLLQKMSDEAGAGEVRIPLRLRLSAPEPAFGSEDLRRPPATRRLSEAFKRSWFRTRQLLRPRARIRQWFQAAGR